MTTAPAWLDTVAWPWQPRSLRLADGELHLLDEGRGDPVVLVHGTPTWSFDWRHVIRGLSARRRLIAFDHLGFGLSERPAAAGYAPEDHARRFGDAMQALRLDEPVTLVVHDFGGPIALDWAIDHPGAVKQVVVLNSWMWSFDDDPRMRRQAALLAGSVGRFLYRRCNLSLRVLMPGAYGDRKKLTPEIHRQYLAPFADAEGRGLVLWPLAKGLTKSAAFYDRLWVRRGRLRNVPMTIVWGMKDSAFKPYMLQRWVRAFPDAVVTRVENAGHWPHEEAPDVVVGVVEGRM